MPSCAAHVSAASVRQVSAVPTIARADNSTSPPRSSRAACETTLDLGREQLYPVHPLVHVSGSERGTRVDHLRDLELVLFVVARPSQRVQGCPQSVPGRLLVRPRRQRRGHHVALRLQVTQDQVLFGRDVAEQRSAADPDFLRDLRRRRGIESLLEEQTHSGLDDLVPHRLPGQLPVALRAAHRCIMSPTDRLALQVRLTVTVTMTYHVSLTSASTKRGNDT